MLSLFARTILSAVARRKSLGLSQRQVAVVAGCSQPYLAQVERGRRPLSQRIAQRLESIYEVGPGTYSACQVPRGRPRLNATSVRVRTTLANTPGDEIRSFGFHWKPFHPRPDLRAPVENPFGRLAKHLGPIAGQALSGLRASRGHEDRLWRLLATLGYDSWSEKLLTVQVALTGAELTGLSPRSAGCTLEVVNGKTGKPTRDLPYPCFLLHHLGVSVAWYPQRAVKTCLGYRWPDVVLVVARDRHKVTAVVEVMGSAFHFNRAAERQRAIELGVPLLEVDAALVADSNIVARILEWAATLPGNPSARATRLPANVIAVA